MNIEPAALREMFAAYKNAYQVFGNEDGRVQIVFARRSPGDPDITPVSGISDFHSAQTLKAQLAKIYGDIDVSLFDSPKQISNDKWEEALETPLIIIGGPSKNAYARRLQTLLPKITDSYFHFKEAKNPTKEATDPDDTTWELYHSSRAKNSSFKTIQVTATPPPYEIVALNKEEQKRFSFVDTGFVMKVWLKDKKTPIFWFGGTSCVATAGAVRLLSCKAILRQIQDTFGDKAFSFVVGARGSRHRDLVHSAWIESPTNSSPKHSREWMVVNRNDSNEITRYPSLPQLMKEVVPLRVAPTGAEFGLSLGIDMDSKEGEDSKGRELELETLDRIHDYPIISTQSSRPFAFQIVFPDETEFTEEPAKNRTVQHLKSLLKILKPKRGLILDTTWRLLIPVRLETLGITALFNFLDNEENWFPRHRYIFEVIDSEVLGVRKKEELLEQFSSLCNERGIGVAISVKDYEDLARYQDGNCHYLKVKWQSKVLLSEADSYWKFVQEVGKRCKEKSKYMMLEGMDSYSLLDEARRYSVPLVMGWPSNHPIMKNRMSLFDIRF